MTSQTGAIGVGTRETTAHGWRMSLPCIGMALCSWLSFVDRQVLAVLSPTILAETGMSAQDFGNIVFFFFIAYTLANPLWGSLLDYAGLRVGMFAAVALWTAASVSHAFMTGVAGFAVARALLGLGEGATFPGGLRTAVESLPVEKRRPRHCYLVQRGHHRRHRHAAHGRPDRPCVRLAHGVFVHRHSRRRVDHHLAGHCAPAIPASVEQTPRKFGKPNLLERRFWALVFSYALPVISGGPIITIFPLYLSRGLDVSQAELGTLLWIPPPPGGSATSSGDGSPTGTPPPTRDRSRCSCS